MRVIGLISGGKDSCFNLVQCVAAGHEIVALANLKPKDSDVDEIDSQMYQTVGTSAADFIGEALGLPLYVGSISGSGNSIGRDYLPTKGDEVEDLYDLLKRVSEETGAEGVSVGAILSDYQRVRVENVCSRLKLTSLAYLWRRNQAELLREMISCKMECILIKVACLGLDSSHLEQTLKSMEPTLLKLEKKFGVNVCGEGGEYETYTLDCPLFIKRIELIKRIVVNHTTDPFAPVSYLHLDQLQLVDKDIPKHLSQKEILEYHGIKGLGPDDYIKDLDDDDTKDNKIIDDVAPPQVDCIDDVAPHQVDRLSVSKQEPEIHKDFGGEGWFEIRNLQGYGDTPGECMTKVAALMDTQLHILGVTKQDLIRTKVYIDSMENYAQINKIYSQEFGLNPPVRVCVALGSENMPAGCKVSMDLRGFKNEQEEERRCLHVQGISHWAPANIGPYSQGFLTSSFLHVSGQIGLVPGSMKLNPDKKKELVLALRHVTRVKDAMVPSNFEPSVQSALCYIVNESDANLVTNYWKHNCFDFNLSLYLVDQLPRGANFELEFVYNLNQL